MSFSLSTASGDGSSEAGAVSRMYPISSLGPKGTAARMPGFGEAASKFQR